MTDKRYYAACNGKDGFVSMFDDLFFCDTMKRRYIIKGGPGCGKSTLMKRIANRAEKLGYDTEVYFCSSDITSLDGVIINDIGVCIFDATAPHSYDCKAPGCTDTLVNLGTFWDDDKLNENAETVKLLNLLKADNYRNAYKILEASGHIYDNLKSYYRKHLLNEKMRKAAISYCKRLKSDKISVKKRIVTSISAEGVFTETAFCENAKLAYYIDDNICCGPEFLKIIAENARSEITVCLSPFDTSAPEAVYFENSGILFTTNKNLCKNVEKRTVHSSRFYDGEIKNNKSKIGFEKKCVKELISHACEYFKSAKNAHIEIEKIYSSAIDFAAVDKWSADFISEIFSED